MAGGSLLWTARSILLVSVALHIWASIQLALLKREARQIGYVKRGNVQASYASRTMMWSGPIIARSIWTVWQEIRRYRAVVDQTPT